MGQKVEVSGTGYDLKGGKPLIGGTAYAIKKGRTLIGGTGYDISLLSGTPISELPVGNTVKIAVNGTLRDFLIVHQGLPGAMYDDSCNGAWLLMKDIYENRQWDSAGFNNYKASTINSYLNSTFLSLFDSNIKDAIKQVKIPYRKNGGSGGTDQSGSNGLPAKIFLMSGYEVGWTTSDSSYFSVDGAKLSYFESGGGTSANNKRIANLNGSAAAWWLRSPFTSLTYGVWTVGHNGVYGTYGGYTDASNSSGVRPALIFPSDTLVSDDGTIAT
nr:MAG TPA: tail protein [Caudoviricetes sp.]